MAADLSVALAISQAAEAVFHDREDAGELLGLLVAGPPVHGGQAMVARDLRNELEALIRATASRNWRPSEVIRQVRRRVGAGAALAAAATIHQAWQRHGTAGADPAWAHEASSIPATPWRLNPAASTWASDVLTAVKLIGLLSHLPALPKCRADEATADQDADASKARMLEKVHHLLSKAESTNFPEEAEAYTAKAQELLARYSIDRAAMRTRPSARRHKAAAVRRVWIDEPYVPAKSQLLHVVATANRCRSVTIDSVGLATVAGHDDDLDTVETLFTSLLVQAIAQMTAAGSRTDRYGRSRTRAFRQSFLVAFAVRIGQRLREAGEASVSEGVAAYGEGLLPVLASRSSAADEAIDELFPELEKRRISATDNEGWLAGTAAADQAQLSFRSELADQTA